MRILSWTRYIDTGRGKFSVILKWEDVNLGFFVHLSGPYFLSVSLFYAMSQSSFSECRQDKTSKNERQMVKFLPGFQCLRPLWEQIFLQTCEPFSLVFTVLKIFLFKVFVKPKPIWNLVDWFILSSFVSTTTTYRNVNSIESRNMVCLIHCYTCTGGI